jgi:hypothetical protein
MLVGRLSLSADQNLSVLPSPSVSSQILIRSLPVPWLFLVRVVERLGDPRSPALIHVMQIGFSICGSVAKILSSKPVGVTCASGTRPARAASHLVIGSPALGLARRIEGNFRLDVPEGLHVLRECRHVGPIRERRDDAGIPHGPADAALDEF